MGVSIRRLSMRSSKLAIFVPIPFCRFPQTWRQFFYAIRSSEASVLVKKLRSRLESSDDLREYIDEDYLFLYLVRGERIIFLAIKHHRQLSFDLKGFLQN